jgi:four helix bundle protein
MFLTLNHQRLQIYTVSKQFVLACYKLSNNLPVDEKFGMISQIRRAALSVHLNIAEGSSRKSEAERKRFYEISRGSLIEVDAALEIAHELNYIDNNQMEETGKLLINTFKLLCGLMESKPIKS